MTKYISKQNKGEKGNDTVTQILFNIKGESSKCWWIWPLIWTRSHCSFPGFYALALMISINSGLREAPPTRNPSTSFWEASSLQVAPVTEPEKKRFKGRYSWGKNQNKNTTRTISSHRLTSIDDPHGVGYSLRHVGLQPPPQFIMNLLSLRYRAGNGHIMTSYGKRSRPSFSSGYLYLPAGGKRSCQCRWPTRARTPAQPCSSPSRCLWKKRETRLK